MRGVSEHAEWFSLIDISGPFLATQVLNDVFPQGLDKVETRRRQRLRAAYDEWRDAVDEDDSDLAELHGVWTRMVIQETLEYEDEVLASNDRLGGNLTYRVLEYGGEVGPDFAVLGDDGKPRLLIAVHPPDTDLEKPLPGDRWSASPQERMALMCRANEVRVGLVTDGERWMVVNAPSGSTSGFATWLARLWWQEPTTYRAFVSLLGVRRCFGTEDQRLDRLLERSIEFQKEVTDTLGEQVRRAVEVLIQALGRADQDRSGELLRDVAPAELYEAGLTVMMRLVFLLCAEERGLLLLGDPIYDQHYAVATLRAALREEEALHGPEVLERRHDAWSRMLAVFRAVYGGIEHETLRLPALGGSLFNPDRFPFLEGRAKGTAWLEEPASPLPIDNRTMLLLLTALQVLEQRGGAQLLSYRALDVEQIGHVYEGLLEYTVVKVLEITVGLIGSRKVPHPGIGLTKLESLLSKGQKATADYLAELTGRSRQAIKTALGREADEGTYVGLLQACGGDEPLVRRLLPFVELIRADSWGHPLVYRVGSFAVTRGPERRETGTHYTPRSLTETIVERTLEPIVYEGPADGKSREDWSLRSPAELLDLKICDPAMGSGAFLVQVCRYLSGRLVEAWAREEEAGRHVTVDGVIVDTQGEEDPLPRDLNDRLLIAKRLIAERCLYGVDLNPLAVELAKLSIWLTTMAKGRPFAFLDHNLRLGDSLLGIYKLDQLTELDLRPGLGPRQHRLFGRGIDAAVQRGVELRTRLRQVRVRDIRDVEAIARLNDETRSILEGPTLIADALIGEALRSAGNATISAAACDRLAIEADHFIRGDKDAGDRIRAAATEALAVGLSPERSPRRTFHWPLEFPEVFLRPNTGFDAVVGNPPFLNAIEHADLRDDYVRGYYSASYQPFASGAYDLCMLFWGRVLLHLLGRQARYGLLSPTVILSSTSDWKRWMHAEWRPDFFCLNPVDMFTVARIRTTSICGARGHASHFEFVDQDTRVAVGTPRRSWSDADINWYEAIQSLEGTRRGSQTMQPTIRLGDLTEISAGCTTADAYNLKPHIDDRRHGRGPKLVTTGAIDRYVLKWGEMRIRYLKDDYDHPRWPERASDRGVSRAAARQSGMKILVGGLTAVIEAWLDASGETAGVVQTWVLKPKAKSAVPDTAWWHVLLGMLNSATFSRVFVNRHGAAAMSGKQITVKKKSLLDLPIPDLQTAAWNTIEGEAADSSIPPSGEWSSAGHVPLIATALARAVSILLAGGAKDSRFAALDKLAHHLAGALYGLSESEREEDYIWWCDRTGSMVYHHSTDWEAELRTVRDGVGIALG